MKVRESVEISSDEEMSPSRITDINRSVLTYRNRFGTIELHRESIRCLSPSYYVKDNIIQFYLAYLLDEKCDEKTAERTHIFDTIFYQDIDKVFRDDKIDQNKLEESRKWYRHVNIFDKDFLIVPICQDDHWRVAIICYPRAVKPVLSRGEINDCDIKKLGTGDYIDKEDIRKENEQNPSIIIMDSLGLKPKSVSFKLRDFLDYEWRSQLSKNKVIKRFSHDDLRDYYPRLPCQKNAYDCGLYMLVYIKVFLKEPDYVYSMIRSEREEKIQNLKVVIRKNLSRTTRESIKGIIFSKTCQDK